MGRRSLLLLTDFYPYEVGEEFLEQEIETLCAAYDEVVVVPVRLSEGARQTRALPAFGATVTSTPASRIRATSSFGVSESTTTVVNSTILAKR